jgi:hypothetical protein
VRRAKPVRTARYVCLVRGFELLVTDDPAEVVALHNLVAECLTVRCAS